VNWRWDEERANTNDWTELTIFLGFR